MPESLEPKTNPFHRVLGTILWIALPAVLIGGGFALVYGGKPTQTVSPAELQEVLAGYRQSRREAMIKKVRSMREYIVKMRDIRADRRKQAEEKGADFGPNPQRVLTDKEKAYRDRAMQPLDDMDFIEVYETARAVEQDAHTIYREFLAAKQMAQGRGLTYLEAYGQSEIPTSNRPKLDEEALYREIVSTAEGEGLGAFRAQIHTSTVETDEMLDKVKKLYEFTKRSNSVAGDGLSPDMSSQDRAMVGYKGPELLPDEMDFTFSPDVGSFDALPGRRLVTGGRAETWLYVDTWYIIGPFPGDPRREKLDVKFGPEANVNLDDVLMGKGGQKVRWEYKKVGWNLPGGSKRAYWKIEPRVVHDDAIYYAFTEIYSDAPRKIWIATATDDYGKLWINDKLVWTSPTTRKPYNALENIQQVQLKQGHNKILYRVENGGGTMGFSLMVRLSSGPRK